MTVRNSKTEKTSKVSAPKLEQLVQRLIDAEAALQNHLAGQADAIVGQGGRPLLLAEAQQQLAQSEAVQRQAAELQTAILDALPANIALVDAKGVILVVNDSWRRFGTENSAEDADFYLGQNYLEVCDRTEGEPAEDAQVTADGIRRVLQDELNEFSHEYPCHSPTEQRWFRVMVSPMRSEHRSGAVVMHVNITARRRVEDEMRCSEEKQRQLAEQLAEERSRLLVAQAVAKVGSWETDLATMQVTWSDETHRIFGSDPENFSPTHENFLARVHPADRDHVTAAFKRSLTRAGMHRVQHRAIETGRRVKYVEERWRIVKDDKGKALRAIGTCQDITEQHFAAEQLVQSEALLRIAVRMVRLGGWTIELPERKLTWSDENCLIHDCPVGYKPTLEEGIGHYLPEDRELVRRCVEECATKGTPYEFELPIVTTKGQRKWVRSMGEAVRNEEGRIVRLQGAFLDLTEQHRNQEELRLREERFRLLASATNDAIWDLDLQADRLWWSEGHAKLFGHAVGDTTASIATWRDFLHPEDRERVLQHVVAAIEGSEATYTNEYRYRRADDTYAYVLDRAQITRDSTGRAIRLIGGMTDLTRLKQAEEDTRRQNETLESIVSALQEISTANIPLQAVMELITARAQLLTGADGAAIGIIAANDLVYPAASGSLKGREGMKVPRAHSLSGLVADKGRWLISDDTEIDERVDRATCRKVGARSILVAPLHDGSNIIGVLQVIASRPQGFTQRDAANLQILLESLGAVIQRQHAVDDLRSSEEHYRLLFASNPQPMWVYDVETFRFLMVNAAAVHQYGYTEDEFRAMTIRDIRPEEDVPAFLAKVGQLQFQGKNSGIWRHRRKDGSVLQVEIHSDAVKIDGRPARLIMALDVTEQKQAMERIEQQAALIDQARDAFIVSDLDHHITFWSRGAERLYGWSRAEAVGQRFDELLRIDREEFAAVERATLAGGEWSGEIHKSNKSGGVLTIDERRNLLHDKEGRARTILSIDTDITERKKLEQQFFRAQRMESIGTLAGGIAHDLNNLLAPVVMGAGLLRHYQPSESARRVIENIERSALRGSNLVKQVLSFARGVEGARVAVQLKPIVREIEGMIASTFPKNIQVEIEVPDDLWLVVGDTTQLNQVLLNLSVNARDAMPDGGRLTITAGNATIDEQYVAMNQGVAAGRYVLLEVTDTGCGMPREVVDRIFEPFFTTKELGNGTGLGLSTVQAIVRSHNGFVYVYSEVGKGTAFKVYVPAQSATAGTPAVEASKPAPIRGRGELILVVDDESPILSVTAQTLEAFGYRVVTAEDGAQAIGLYAVHQQEIAVVLTDMMMPVMDGPALIAALRRINPTVPIIAASGLNANANVARATAAGVKHFLAKPYTADTLLRVLAKVLQTSTSRPPL